MADEDKSVAAAKAAEERAAKAESEAKALRDAAKAREDAEARAKADAEAKDIESAKRLASEATEREKKAREEADQYRKILTDQTNAKLARLDESKRARVQKYADKLSLLDYAAFVDEEVGKGASDPAPAADDKSDTIPPPASPTGRIKDTRGVGRELEPQTQRILDEMAVPRSPAEKLLTVQREDGKAKFILGPKELITLMRERSIGPKVLSAENAAKMIDSVVKK